MYITITRNTNPHKLFNKNFVPGCDGFGQLMRFYPYLPKYLTNPCFFAQSFPSYLLAEREKSGLTAFVMLVSVLERILGDMGAFSFPMNTFGHNNISNLTL